ISHDFFGKEIFARDDEFSKKTGDRDDDCGVRRDRDWDLCWRTSSYYERLAQSAAAVSSRTFRAGQAARVKNCGPVATLPHTGGEAAHSRGAGGQCARFAVPKRERRIARLDWRRKRIA